MSTDNRKTLILSALRAFINQRSGIEFGNYGDVKAFRAEQRSIQKDRREALELLRAVELSDGIDADALIKAAQSAYSGRLTIKDESYVSSESRKHIARFSVDYCTGQYFVTEYRRAACAVLASALWEYTREHCMPVDEHGKAYETYGPKKGGGLMSAGDWLRAHFAQMFGRGIASRWFN